MWRKDGGNLAGFPVFFVRKLIYGARRAAGHVLPPNARRFSSQKGRDDMDAVNRLIKAGIRSDCAAETVLRFEARGDTAGLERYVLDVESRAASKRGGSTCLD